jgi:hypothetical protein
MQRQERIAFAVTEDARNLIAVVPAPGNQITDIHRSSPFVPSIDNTFPLAPALSPSALR